MAFAHAPARKLLPRSAAIVASVAFNLDGVGQFFQDAWLLVKAMADEVAAFFVGLLPPLLPPLAKNIDELFPPETRSETLQRWVHVAVTVVLPPFLGTLALFCLARCCAGALFCLASCCARALFCLARCCARALFCLASCCASALFCLARCCCRCCC